MSPLAAVPPLLRFRALRSLGAALSHYGKDAVGGRLATWGFPLVCDEGAHGAGGQVGVLATHQHLARERGMRQGQRAHEEVVLGGLGGACMQGAVNSTAVEIFARMARKFIAISSLPSPS